MLWSFRFALASQFRALTSDLDQERSVTTDGIY